MTSRTLLAVNGGSSSPKCGLFDVTGGAPTPLKSFNVAVDPAAGNELETQLQEILARMAGAHDVSQIVAVGHRVVHGGSRGPA